MPITREYVNEERAVERYDWSPFGQIRTGDFLVHAYSIISTDSVVLDVWETTEGFKAHSCSRTSEEYGRLGQLTSRALPPELDALPFGPIRMARVEGYLDDLRDEAEKIIASAYPELVGNGLRLRYGAGSCSLDAFHATRRQAA